MKGMVGYLLLISWFFKSWLLKVAKGTLKVFEKAEVTVDCWKVAKGSLKIVGPEGNVVAVVKSVLIWEFGGGGGKLKTESASSFYSWLGNRQLGSQGSTVGKREDCRIIASLGEGRVLVNS